MDEQSIHIVTYMRASRAAVWEALTNPEVTQRYWGGSRVESDWQVGAKLVYRRDGEVTDEHVLLECKPPERLVHTFHPVFGAYAAEAPSRVEIELEAARDMVRLTLVHDGFPPGSLTYAACREGWPRVLSNLKTLLETGETIDVFAFE
jgi:uncharacterized protein YndB with AHSA1/START domain